MATASNTASSEERSQRGRSGRSGAQTLRKSVTNAVNTDTILDLVQRLGLFDLFVDRVRARLEEVDIDEFLDDIGAYLKRNPEVIVIGLATITMAAGALVYLERKERDRDWFVSFDSDEDELEEEEESPRPARARTSGASAGGAKKRS